MIKIGILIPSLRGGGAERVSVLLAKQLEAEDYFVDFILFENKNQVYETSTNIVDLNLGYKSNLTGRLSYIFKRYSKIKSTIRLHQYNIIISFMPSANIYAALARLSINFKLISTIHNYKFGAINDTSITLSNSYLSTKFVVRKSDFVVSVSNEISSRLSEIYPKYSQKFVTIYNFIENQKSKLNAMLLNDILTFKQTSKLLVNTGRLEFQKGQWLLIEALEEVVKEGYDVKLVIIGEGKLRNDLKSLISSRNLTNRVKLIGFVKQPYTYYHLFDVFVLSSLHEGMSLVIVEAMAEGLPIISTDCLAGPREILYPSEHTLSVSDKNNENQSYGLLVSRPNQDYDIYQNTKNNKKVIFELKNQIIKLISDSELNTYYRKMSVLRSLDFNPNAIMNEWLKILN